MVGKLTPNDMMSCSRLPALLGFSKFRTPNDELKASMDYIATGKDPEFIGNEAMDWGNKLEAQILEEACKRLGIESYDLKHDQPYFHDSIPLACSLDGTAQGAGQDVFTDISNGIYVMNDGTKPIKLDGVGILEAKLTGQDVEDSPAIYRGVIQLQGQMDIMKAKWGALCVLYRGTTLRVFIYERSEDQVALIHQAVEEFQVKLDKFKSNEETDWYPLSDSNEASRVFDHAEKAAIEIPEVELLAEKILSLREEIFEKEKSIDDLQVAIMNNMRDFEICNAGRYRISWPMRQYKAQPAKTTPAKPAYVIRQSKLSIKDRI